MPTLIEQVKSRLFIASSRPSQDALEGAYPSILRGRSLDFEDLHRYEFGDDIRDIDWRATARLGTPLVKRSRAERAQTVLFAVDTGRSMAALAADQAPKRDLAILATGVLAYLSIRHGDRFALVHGDAAGVTRTPARRTEGALETALRAIRDAISPASAPSDRDRVLDFIVRTVRRRCILVVISDRAPVTEETGRLVRRLRAQHDLLWLTLSDADPVPDERHPRASRADVDTGWRIPDFLAGDDDVVAEIRAADRAEDAVRDALLEGSRVTHIALDGQATAVPALLAALDRRSRVRDR